jgi:hypothetical protein
MAIVREYAYRIRGRKIALYERDAAYPFDNDLTNRQYGGLRRGEYKSPIADVLDGLVFEYVFRPKFRNAADTADIADSAADETSTISLPSYISKALVYYMKARLAEDEGDFKAKEYLMREFKSMLERHESAKIVGARRIIPGTHAIR